MIHKLKIQIACETERADTFMIEYNQLFIFNSKNYSNVSTVIAVQYGSTKMKRYKGWIIQYYYQKIGH